MRGAGKGAWRSAGRTAGTASLAGADASEPQTASGIVQFLSLFLLLLVFFIVFDGQSVRRQDRTQAVLASLDGQFPAIAVHPRLRDGDDPVASRLGRVHAATRLEGLGELFATAIAVSKVNVVTPGRLIEVRLPQDALFIPSAAAVRGDRQGLIDRIVDSLRQSLDGARIELDILLAIDDGRPSQPPGPVQRAASLARALTADGAPARSFSIGVERGDGGTARLLFSVRDDAGRIVEGRP